MKLKYCPECGELLQVQWIAMEGRDRSICRRCNAIRYDNPRILVSTVVVHEQRLLLCRRAQEPSSGLWNLPSGFLERGETLEVAAARETFEETAVRVQPDDLHLYVVTSLTKMGEVYVCFRIAVESEECSAGRECLEARFFDERDVPWDQLAFREMYGFLRLFFRELHSGEFGIHLSRVDEVGRFRKAYRLFSPPRAS
jgi:ADP-ribose pyrophosphatase YjhB (NUDIX family)